MHIIEGGLDDPRVVALVHLHVALGLAASEPGTAHPLDIATLQTPAVRFWTAWEGGEPVAIGALRRLSDDHGELKSMHTLEAVRGRGIGGALLRHIMAEGARDGIARLSLRTGSQPYFDAARALYRGHGFTPCPAFEGQDDNETSVFMTQELKPDEPTPNFPSPLQGRG